MTDEVNPPYPYYWIFPSTTLPTELINQARQEADSGEYEVGTTLHKEVMTEEDLKIRNMRVHFVNEPSHWLLGTLFNLARIANINSGWRRELYFNECVQYGKYDENQYYTWHRDADITNILSFDQTCRKLSTVMLLSDSSEFEGGELEIEGVLEQPHLEKGSIIVFPSILKHRVTPVTKGCRVSAVSWIHGPNVW